MAFDVRSKMQGRPSFIGMMMSGLNRKPAPAAVPAPVELEADDARQGTPASAPTAPEDLPGDLDKVGTSSSSDPQG